MTHRTIQQIGKDLGADTILEGTVERPNGRVRLRVQLIEAARNQHLWAQSYERKLSDILAVERSFSSRFRIAVLQFWHENPRYRRSGSARGHMSYRLALTNCIEYSARGNCRNIAIALTMPDQVTSWIVGKPEVIQKTAFWEVNHCFWAMEKVCVDRSN